MRLLSPKEVKGKRHNQETDERNRLSLISEQIARKEKILNTVVEEVDKDKGKALKEFETFKVSIVEQKSTLNSSVYALEQRKALLEAETLRERAETKAIEDLESDFLKKKQKEQEVLKERESLIVVKENVLFRMEQDSIERLRDVDKKEIMFERKDKRLEVERQELEKAGETLSEEKWERNNQVRREKEILLEQAKQVAADRSSNDTIKEHLENGWQDLEKEKLDVVHERNSIQDRIRETEEQQRKVEVQVGSNERVQQKLEEEYRKMEREKIVLKESRNESKKIREKIDKENRKLKGDISSYRTKKQHLDSEKRELENDKIKLKDERAILDSAWSEMKSKKNG